jgi:OmcA/MtrC family decaheme c-type cytochrome
MQRRQRTHGLLGTAAAAVLLAMTLGLAGCGSDGDDGAQGPPGPPGPPGQDATTVTGAAAGIDSPNASLCYSCHQHVDESGLIRAHINALGGEMYGFGTHIDEGAEGCSTCHGGMRPGGTRPVGLSPELHAGGQHQASRPSLNASSITDVSVTNGVVTIEFQVNNFQSPTVNAEFTIAKWVEEEGSWINLLQRRVGGGADARVIRAAPLRMEGADIVTGGVTTDGNTTFTYTFISDRDNGWGSAANFAATQVAKGAPLDFRNGPLWRVLEESAPTGYCAVGDTACLNFVQAVMNDINADGGWDLAGTYRIGVTGRDVDANYVRFAAVADVDLDGSGGVAAVGPPAPNNQIAQGSCNTCHEARLVFPRNDVHGQQRPAIAVCSNCHNNYTYDANASTETAGGWANISLATMAHKIHSGIEGYTVAGYEYENVAYPDWTLAGTSNCSSCHNATADGFGGGWNRQDPPVATACANCHTAGGYDVQVGPHAPGNPTILGNCATCHGDVAIAGLGYQQTPDVYHGVSTRLEALRAQREDYQFSLVSVSDAVYEGTPVIQWQVLDGGGVPYNLSSDISIDGGPRLHIGWGYGDDWTNEGSGEKSVAQGRQNDDGGRPVALNVATTGDNANTVISADGLTAISTFPRFTDAEAGKGNGFANLEKAEEGRRGFVAIHRRVADNGTLRMLTSLVQPIILGSGENKLAPQRRNTVNGGKGGRGTGCLDCHGTIVQHGGGYAVDNNIQACITCHNAGSHKSLAVMGGEPPYSVDFMYLMHKVHSSPDTLYPQVAQQRCHACHVGYADDRDVNVEGSLSQDTNCNLCHNGVINDGRIGIISDWPGAFSRYGLRGDGTDGQ